MKYLREVTPYFRKTSALHDLGWGTQEPPPGPQDHGGLKHTDRKQIPLKLCYLCHNLSMPDNENRTIEIYSPDGKSSCILRCAEESIAQTWYNAIHSNIYLLAQQAVMEANQILSGAPTSREITFMGWLAEQVNYYTLHSIYCIFLFDII